MLGLVNFCLKRTTFLSSPKAIAQIGDLAKEVRDMFGLRWLVSTVLILGLIWALMPESVRGQPQVVPVSEILAGKHTNQWC